jgi:hypothetical protein
MCREQSRHPGAVALKHIIADPEIIAEYRVFQTVRHPADVLVSEFLLTGNSALFTGLHDWLMKGCPAIYQQTNGETRGPKTSLFFIKGVTDSLRYETLQDDLRRTFGDHPLQHDTGHKTRRKGSWEGYWAEDSREWARKNLADLERHGYLI